MGERYFTFQLAGIDSDNFAYVGKRTTGLGIEWHGQSRMRLILDAPFLSGRVDDVIYTSIDPLRPSIPGVSLYADGGISRR
jgi:hypothetical protein